MKIQPFREKDIRSKIQTKADPIVKKGNSKHDKGYIYLGNVLVGKVTIPNDHTKVMYQSRSKYIAENLYLSPDQFNEFVICTLKRTDYLKILEGKNLI
jgi:hypothetical protein